jgi:PAS domain S-box-containing protein
MSDYMPIIRALILAFGWPVLIIGSIAVSGQIFRFFHTKTNTSFKKIFTGLVIGWCITMYSLGIVSTLLMFINVQVGVLVVAPIFIIWFVCMTILLLIVFRWMKQEPFTNQLNLMEETGFLNQIIKQAPIGIYTINKKGVIDSFNPKMMEMAGTRDAGEVIGMNVFEMSSYKEAGLDILFKEGLNGKPFDKETRYVSLTGKKETWRHYRGVPLYDAEGKTVERLLLLVADVTDRKGLEEKLTQYASHLEVEVSERTKNLEFLKEQYKAVIEGSLIGMYVLQDGVYKYLNSMFVKIFGYTTPDELIGKPWQILISKEDIPLLEQGGINERMKGQGESKQYSFHGVKKDGTVIEIEVLSNPSVYEEKPAIVGSLQDITKRSEMERKIQDHVKELEYLNSVMINREVKMAELKKKLEKYEPVSG